MSLPTLRSESRSFFRRALRHGLRLARKISPRSLNVDMPVCQLFLGGYGKRTVYTFVNFPSLYCPRTAASCHYALTLYDQDGVEVARGRVTVPPFGTAAVRLEDVLRRPLPELGLLAAQIRPSAPFSYADHHLGTITAHFYAMYHDEEMRSLSVIHPQTTLWGASPPRMPWRSNLLIRPETIEAVEIFQINPATTSAQTTLSVSSPDGKPIVSSTSRIPARGVRRIYWPAVEFRERPFVVLTADAVTAPNAKPLLFQHYQTGFCAAHS